METKWDRDLHRAAAVGSTKLLQKTLNTGKVHIDCQDEVKIAISMTFFSRQIHSCIITFLMLTQSLVGYGVVIFNALYILCIKHRYCDRSHLSKQRRFPTMLLRKWKERLSLCWWSVILYWKPILVHFSLTFSGRNYAPNVGHSQPSSQLCANSTKRRSGTTLKIQRNFTISFTT